MTKFSNAKYDLEERTAVFAEKAIDLLKKVPNTSLNKRRKLKKRSIGFDYWPTQTQILNKNSESSGKKPKNCY